MYIHVSSEWHDWPFGQNISDCGSIFFRVIDELIRHLKRVEYSKNGETFIPTIGRKTNKTKRRNIFELKS
jgi:hypothetical protein